MEYIPGDTAKVYFQKPRTLNSTPEAIKFLLLCLETLTVVHKKGILHM